MKERKKISEKSKNIIIILLIISAVFLGWESRLFGNASVELNVFADLIGGDEDSGSGGVLSGGDKTTGEARPVSIAVTNSAGAHYGVRYNMDEIGHLYDKAVLIFREALGSAQQLTQIDGQAWRASLLSPGIFFEYMSPIHLSVLDAWFGNMTGDWGEISTRRLCVAAVDGKTHLYFQDEENGLFYMADTIIMPDRITVLTDTYTANETSFAFEIIDESALKVADALIMPDVPHPLIEAKNPLSDTNTQNEVLRKLGVSEHLKPIPVENGVAYIDENLRIELSPDGTINYKRTGGEEETLVQPDESGAIELARQAVATSIGKYCGEARVYFYDAVSKGNGAYQIMFTYVVAGGQVYLGQDAYAATITIENGVISEMELRFRSYAVSGVPVPNMLLPEIQAAAASGGAFMLYYPDNGGTSLAPSWVAGSTNS